MQSASRWEVPRDEQEYVYTRAREKVPYESTNGRYHRISALVEAQTKHHERVRED